MNTDHHTATWVAAARKGDCLALAKLLALHHPALAGRVAARLDPALRARVSPEDVLQEVYLQVFRRLDQFDDRGPDAFLRWVSTILDHKLVDARRAARRQQRDVAREHAPAVAQRSTSSWNLLDQVYRDSATPSRVARRDEAVAALQRCLSDLSEVHRQVLEQRFFEGRSVAEVARHLRRSEGAVIALTQRALKALRAAMDQHGEHTRGG